MESVFAFLKNEPFILIFVVVAAGFLLARIHIRGISVGVVASTLIGALLLSLAATLWNVAFEPQPLLQAIFFNLYIFCVGLRVGPQCFAGFERNGKQFLRVVLAALVVSALLAVLCGWMFHLDAGTLAGVLAGSNTASASFGAAQSAAQSGAAGPDGREMAVRLSVSFAIAYALSLVIFVVALPFLPRITRSDAPAAAREAERELSGGKQPLPQTPEAFERRNLPVDIRAYRIEKARAAGRSVAALTEQYPRLSIEAVRRAGRMLPVEGNLVLQLGDEVALGSELEAQLHLADAVGPEIDAPELRNLTPETADVVITRAELAGATLEELTRGAGHGLYFSALFRMGEEIPLHPQTEVKHGDVLRVTGTRAHVAALAAAAGRVVESSTVTDLLTVAAGLVLGGVIGAIAVPLGGIDFSIGTAAGLLLVAIVMSWIRTRHPQFGGPVPEPARRLLEDLGLSVFIAIVGLDAGPGLIQAFGAGSIGPIVMSTLILGFAPPLAAWFAGLYAFKLNPALLLGAVVGARQSSPALKVAQDYVGNSTPAIGFAVPFTIATIVFTLYGYLAMVLWPIK